MMVIPDVMDGSAGEGKVLILESVTTPHNVVFESDEKLLIEFRTLSLRKPLRLRAGKENKIGVGATGEDALVKFPHRRLMLLTIWLDDDRHGGRDWLARWWGREGLTTAQFAVCS